MPQKWDMWLQKLGDNRPYSSVLIDYHTLTNGRHRIRANILHSHTSGLRLKKMSQEVEHLKKGQVFLTKLLHGNPNQRGNLIKKGKPNEIKALLELLFNYGNFAGNAKPALPPPQWRSTKEMVTKLCINNMPPRTIKRKILKPKAKTTRYSNLYKIGAVLYVLKTRVPSFLQQQQQQP